MDKTENKSALTSLVTDSAQTESVQAAIARRLAPGGLVEQAGKLGEQVAQSGGVVNELARRASQNTKADTAALDFEKAKTDAARAWDEAYKANPDIRKAGSERETLLKERTDLENKRNSLRDSLSRETDPAKKVDINKQLNDIQAIIDTNQKSIVTLNETIARLQDTVRTQTPNIDALKAEIGRFTTRPD